MSLGKFRALSLVVWALTMTLVAAQITFSRDWTGGKRAAPSYQPLDCSQFTRLCRQFVHELRASEESRYSKHHRPDSEDQPSYDDDQ